MDGVQAALKGKNKYKRTAVHRARVSLALKKKWKERKEAGARPKPKRCSICGEQGHNRQTCPVAKNESKTRHRKPRSFEHRWKIGAANRKIQAEKKKQKQQQLNVRNETRTRQNGVLCKCSYCGEIGHNKRTCPKRKQDLVKAGDTSPKENSQKASMTKLMEEKKAQESNVVPRKTKKRDTVRQPKTSEVDDLKSLYTVPVKVDQMWQLALDCASRAYRNGINRQQLNFTFPMLRDGATVDPMLSSNSDIVRQFRVATLIVEAVLNGIKKQPGLEGRLDVGILDEEEGTVYWEGSEINAILFPQPDSLDTMISRGMMRRNQAPRLQLMVNPLWQPGQVVSDFGFGQLKALRENFVNSFEDVFYMKQISVFSDIVIVMRCYPSQWQVHLVEPDGTIALVGTSQDKPDFDSICLMLRSAETSLSRLNWIDRLRTKYIKRQKRLSPFPLSLSKSELEACFDNADLSIAERIHALNTATPKKRSLSHLEEIEEEPLDTDIVTGEPVHDIKLDPVKQFASFLGQK